MWSTKSVNWIGGQFVLTAAVLLFLQGTIQELKLTNAPNLASVQCDDILPVSPSFSFSLSHSIVSCLLFRYLTCDHTHTHIPIVMVIQYLLCLVWAFFRFVTCGGRQCVTGRRLHSAHGANWGVVLLFTSWLTHTRIYLPLFFPLLLFKKIYRPVVVFFSALCKWPPLDFEKNLIRCNFQQFFSFFFL